MKQLTRKLSLQATFKASPSILAMPDQEFFWENLHELSGLNVWDWATIGIHTLAIILHMFIQDDFSQVQIVFISIIVDVVYLKLLPKLFLAYQGTFSFGEGCLFLQGYVIL